MKQQINPAASLAEAAKQKEYIALAAAVLSARFPDRKPKAFVHTYGCQGNVSDSERMKGLLQACGYEFCDAAEEADFVLFNTCAVREHAEDRVYGNCGALKPIKEKNPDLIIALCGCMMQQQHVSERIKKSYPFVNLVFGTFAFHRLPELLYKVLTGKKRVFETEETKGEIAEGLPVYRDRAVKAWLPVMYGCDNFCSYCVVPYVRGRERSRGSAAILEEARQLIADGAKEITLLGQNVNSYGKGLDEDIDFPALLRKINALDGDFIIRFMTSHPKDCTKELLDAMAECKKCARHLHLPVQSGSNRILKEMNRRYTREHYISLVRYAREVMPDISLTTDIITGFPGETYDEFCDTVSLVREINYTSMFTFIYSPRKGTKAAQMPDPVPYAEKSKWMRELLAVQEEIAAKRTADMIGKTYRVLVEDETKEKDGLLTGRTAGNVNIDFAGDRTWIGTFCEVKVTDAGNWVVHGELVK